MKSDWIKRIEQLHWIPWDTNAILKLDKTNAGVRTRVEWP